MTGGSERPWSIAVLGQTARSCRRNWTAAWLEAWSNRRSFWVQVLVMILNDAIWILFWLLFFNRIGSLRGWDIDKVLVLLAVLTTSAGIVLGLLTNARRIGELATDGNLDATLALPTATLPHLLTRRIETTNVGDLLFGIGLFVVAGDPTPQRTLVFLFGVVCSVGIMAGFLILVGSSAFFLGRNEAGELGFNALLLFSSYPVDVFAGMTKIFLYAVVPAGFISVTPANLITEFQWRWAAASLGMAGAMVAAGVIVFHLGLRRYTSGSTWTDA